MYNDTVSDFLTRVRNASMATKPKLSIRSSKMIESIAKVLQDAGYIAEINKGEDGVTVTLNDNQPIIHLKRISRPSLRRYVSYTDIPRPRSGLGMVILSTPKGVLSGNQARKQKVGGELLCEVW